MVVRELPVLDWVAFTVPLQQGHAERSQDQRCGLAGRGTPRDDPLGEHIDDERHVRES